MSDMMAFVFFMLWMLACLGLLTVWVFRQSPPAGGESARGVASGAKALSAEG
jgi:hypothetical protein